MKGFIWLALMVPEIMRGSPKSPGPSNGKKVGLNRVKLDYAKFCVS